MAEVARKEGQLVGTSNLNMGFALPIIVILNLPAALAVDILAIPAHGLIGDDSEVVGGLVAKELLQESTDNRVHS